MPPVFAAVMAIANIAIGTTTLGAIIVTAVVGAVVSFGISALAAAISKPKPSKLSNAASFGGEIASRLQISRNSVESHKVIYGRVRTSGPLVMVATTDRGSAKNDYLHLVIALAAHECDGVAKYYIDEDEVTIDGSGNVTTTKYMQNGVSYARLKIHLGASDQAADSDLMSEVAGWTDKHRLRGITYIYARLRFSRDIFPNGIPQISATLRGKKLYDPRTETTAYSSNSALCTRDYLTSTAYGLGATDAEIDDASFIASANNCEEIITVANGTTQYRYSCNGIVDTAEKPINILKDLSTSMAGVIPYVQGKFRCFSGYYTAPSISIDESWLAGDIEIQAKKPRNELFNAVKGVFVDSIKQWQPSDFPMVTNATYEAQDGGVRIVRDLELPYTVDAAQAQRIAKIALEQGRQGIVAKMPCNFKALQVSIMDTVSVSIDQLGWSSKVFRVVQWELNLDGGFTLTLQEESSSSYDWNNGEETVIDDAPDTNLPDLLTVEAPGNPVITEELYETTDGSGVKTKAILTWAESPHSYVREYVVEYKLSSDTDHIPAGKVESNTPTISIFDIAPGRHNFRVKAVNVRGVSSDYAVSTYEVRGLTAPPSDVTGLVVRVSQDSVHASWDLHPDLDVRNGGRIRLKLGFEGSWSSGRDVIDALPGNATSAVLPAAAGYYMVKAYDSTGNESVNATISTPVSTGYLNAVQTGTTNDDTNGYPGTLDGFYAEEDGSDYYLRLEPTALFDDIAGDFDDGVGNFDDGVGSGFVESAEYIFASYEDSAYVQNWRITPILYATVGNGIDLFDLAAGDFDDREGLFEGGDLSEVTLDFYVKTTEDDPTGSTYTDPIWSDWERLPTVRDIRTRAFWFKVVANNLNTSNQIRVYNAYIAYSQLFRDEIFLSQSLASGGSSITYTDVFNSKPYLGVTIDSPTSGDTVKVTHASSGGWYTGATVQILNGGVGVARTVDITVTGF